MTLVRGLPKVIALLMLAGTGWSCIVGRLADPQRPVQDRGEYCPLTRAFQLETVYAESRNFTATMADASGREQERRRKGILRLGRYIAGEIRSEFAAPPTPGAALNVTVMMTHIDIWQDDLDSGSRTFRACLSCMTLLVYPSDGETEEKIKVQVRDGDKVIREYEYTFHRLRWMSWLVLPFNILITPFSDTFTLDLHMEDTRFRRELPRLTESVRRDMRRLKCELANKNNQPVAFSRTEPAARLSRRPSGE